MEIKKNFKNDLLKRKEVEVIVDSESNPNFAETQKQIASEFKTGENLVIVKRIKGHFGRKDFLVEALIYDSEDAKKATEPKEKVKKEAGK